MKAPKVPVELKALRKELRAALADYDATKGCGCCGDREAHGEAAARLGKLLGVRKYSDGSGYDFARYRRERTG